MQPRCITPPPDNNGISASGSTYTLNNSGDITVKSTVVKAFPIARDAALVSAGADLRVTRQATFGVAYLGNLASNAQDHSVKGVFSRKF